MSSLAWNELQMQMKALWQLILQSNMFLMDYFLTETSIFSSSWKVTSSVGSLTLTKMLGDCGECLHLLFTLWQPHQPCSSNQSQKYSLSNKSLLNTYWYKDTQLHLINSLTSDSHSYPEYLKAPAGGIEMRKSLNDWHKPKNIFIFSIKISPAVALKTL